jgi:CRISPR-associated endonuclease/helicase Cas3
MPPVESVQSYVDSIAGRPEWALWGKAQPPEGTAVAAHPLLCHMIDVAVAGEMLLRDAVPASTRDRLLESLGGAPATAVQWLMFIVALHDLGKATPPFQVKFPPAVEWLTAAGFDVRPPKDGRDHARLGVSLAREALVNLGVDEQFAHQLARAVAAHHGAFPTDYDSGRPLVGTEAGRSPLWKEARRAIVASLAETLNIVGLKPPAPLRERDWAFASALAGFVSVSDWLGSMAEVFVYEPPPQSLSGYLPMARERARCALAKAGFRHSQRTSSLSFDSLFGFPPRPLQAALVKLTEGVGTPACVIVEAPMGEGKTEGALYVSNALDARGAHDGTYLGLPTQATANQMFDRLTSFLERTRPDQITNLQLVHGEAIFDTRVLTLLRAVHGPGEGLVCEPWFLGKKRALLAPFAAGTIDQALLAVLRTKHAFVRQFGLARKTVILDEVHAYDTYTSTLLDSLVAWLGALGATVVMLSATLPSGRRRKLLEAYAGRPLGESQDVGYPRVSWVDRSGGHASTFQTGRASMRVRLEWFDDSPTSADVAIDLAAAGANVVILRNTVARAQETMRSLLAARARGSLSPSVPLLLLHARFPTEERRALETELIRRLGKPPADRPSGMIVVGTQVLEQSLDVDFDAMMTDLAPVDLLLQRAGRLHRHARGERPASAREPVLRVVAPAGDPRFVSLSAVSRVYEPYVVRRTLLALRAREHIALPNDIEHLVEQVYTLEEPAEWRAALESDRRAMQERQRNDELLARTRIWPSPFSPDDPFASMEMPFEAEDADVARALKAQTRLGDEAAEIVCLFGEPSNAYVDRARTRRIDLEAEPTPALIRALALRTVRVAHHGFVRAALELPFPTRWRDVSILARRRPLFFGDAPLNLGRLRVQLDPLLGVVVTTEEPADAVPADD